MRPEDSEIPSRGRKRALLVGIDEYPNFPRSAQLRGAVADAHALGSLLVERFGFAPADVEILTNGAATRAGIIEGMRNLIFNLEPSDAVFFHFSGHGSRRLAPQLLHRGDRQENVLVPCDSSHSGLQPNRDLSGGEIYAWLRHVATKTGCTTFILDSCHAGTFVRGKQASTPERIRVVEVDERPSAPLPFPWALDDPSLPSLGEGGWLPHASTHTLIAACRGDEKAREVTLRQGGTELYHGALTHALIQALKASPEDVTYRELKPSLLAAVLARFPDQHPQIEGALNRVFLHIEERAPRREAIVVGFEGRSLVLDVGAVHDIGTGSTWAIYTPKPNRSGDNKIGEARVTLVRSTRSDATLLSPSGSPFLKIGCRARQLSPGAYPKAFAVALDIPAEHAAFGAALARALDEAPALQRSLSIEEAEVTAIVVPPRRFPGREAKVRVLGPLSKPICALVDPEGAILAPCHGLEKPDVLTVTVANLEALARRRRIEGLENSQGSSTQGKVQLQFLRRSKYDIWEVAKPRRPGGLLDFDEEEEFVFLLTNFHNKALYPYVMNLGVGGCIDLIYPMEGACEPLLPGVPLQVGGREGQEYIFELPDTVPFGSPGLRPWSGTEIFKLIVTEDPTDLGALFQESYRQASSGDVGVSSTVAEQLGLILSDCRREIRTGHSPKTLAWSTETVTIRLHRPRLTP